MTKRTIVETTREYDENGNLTRETVTETKEDDDTAFFPYPVQAPFPSQFWPYEPTCTTTANAPAGGIQTIQ